MIVQQCENCNKKGKNVYCKDCVKVADSFDVYEYLSGDNRFNKGRLISIIEAYTWHEAIEYVRNKFFHGEEKSNIITNCEKDFAYLEKTRSTSSENENNAEELDLRSYKIYLNNGQK
jgi:hypothetical protein